MKAYVPKATLQAAIGALPLAAGLGSGEMILAVAVLSILVTAPLGAIGIVHLGERILDHGDQSVYRFKELRSRLELPHVGERVMNRDTKKIWKVIEEKELWMDVDDRSGDATTDARPQPAIYQRYWVADESSAAGTGKTMERYYTQEDPPFHAEWEVIYDW